MRENVWNKVVVLGTLGILLALAVVTVVIDPFLHYHEPLSFLEYPLKDERYQNDGITRHFEYDALITGTSMTQNFKPSEFEALWHAKTVKASYSGATYHELNQHIRRAMEYRPEIAYVLCSLDGTRLIAPSDEYGYEGNPEYLYDDNPWNDVKYLLNKDVVPKTLAVVNYTRAGEKTPTMDEYGSWNQYMTFGREAVVNSFTLQPIREEEVVLSEEQLEMIEKNVSENFLATALAYPETEFYLFFPPYSICYWEGLVRGNQLNSQLQAEEMAAEILLSAENIHLFSFSDRIDIIDNLNNYGDTLHYGEWVNSEILQCMASGKGELTKDNFKEYFAGLRELYSNYVFDY